MTKAIKTACNITGVLFWVLGLSLGTVNDNIGFIFVNMALILVGSCFLIVPIKLGARKPCELRQADTAEFPTCFSYVLDGDTAIKIDEPLDDWDKCYLIAYQAQNEKAAEQD